MEVCIMSISPITMQMNINMTNDMAQVQNNQNTRSETEHMQFAQTNDRQVKQNSEMVISKDTAQFQENHQYDAKNKGRNEYFNSREKRKKQKQGESDNNKESDEREKKKQLVQIDIKL